MFPRCMSIHRRGLRELVALLIAASCNAPSPGPGGASSPSPATAGSAGAGRSAGSSAPAAAGDLSPELVTYSSGVRALHGFLYRPPGPGPFPAVVFNHGSEPLPGWKPDQAQFYVRHGFVLFLPHRRGQGRSRDAGPSINTLDGTTPAFVDELVAQSDDVMAAVAYVAALPYVDPRRVAVAGCSLGGIESLLAAERGTGLVAAIDFAGAAITWSNNPALQDRMKLAARNAKVPVFFLQAENDYNTAPSRVLSDEMKRAGKPMRVHIFPPNGTTAQDGHALCMGGDHPPWGDEVLAFLAAAMGR
jgi:carboxymethylenebutenolidase